MHSSLAVTGVVVGAIGYCGHHHGRSAPGLESTP